MNKANLLIKNAQVLTMDDNLTYYQKADLAIQGTKIIEISPSIDCQAVKTIEADGKLVMPGLINCHTHAAMSLLRGLADDLPLERWWNDYIFPIEGKFGNQSFIKTGVALAALEMIRSGTTSFADMYFHQAEAAEVCQELGIRAFLGEGVIDFPTPTCQKPEQALSYTRDLYNKYQSDPLISIMVAPHTTYTCSPEVIEQAHDLAQQLKLPMQIHLAETKTETAAVKQQFGLSPVQHLANLKVLSDKMIAVHAVCLDQADISLLKAFNVKVAHCLESNLKLVSGQAPVVELKNQGIEVALGTDGAASNNNLDLLTEMDMVAKVHKLSQADPTVMPAANVLKMATSQAARVVQQQSIGSLEVGKLADIIIIDLEKPHLTPLYNIYSHLVYSASGADVETVIINGQIVMENYQVITIDQKKVLSDARQIAQKIKQAI